jgi:hypothetical protein
VGWRPAHGLFVGNCPSGCNRSAKPGSSAKGHFESKSEAASLRLCWSGPPPGADVLHLAFVLNNVLGSPACFEHHRRPPVGNRFPPNRPAKASASCGLAKQNTTTSLSSRRMEYVSGVADRIPAAQNITSRFTRSRTFSVGLRRPPFLRRRPKTTPECPSDAGYGLRCQSSAAIRPSPLRNPDGPLSASRSTRLHNVRLGSRRRPVPAMVSASADK